MSVFAAELIHKTIWYPTILGFLVVAAAILLFCGSIYLLLATNLGARLGFLVAFTALMGFLVLLSTLWMTTASPLNTLKGRIPGWEVVEIAKTPEKAKTTDVQNIASEGTEVGLRKFSDVKAAVDAALVTKEEVLAEGPLPEDANKFARFEDVTKYKLKRVYEIGGSNPNPLNFELRHTPVFAVAEFCAVKDLGQPFYVPPPKNPECDPNSDLNGSMVLSRDLGSVRVPPMVAFGVFTLLFILGLLMLHWRERDEQEAEQRSTGTALEPAPVNA